MIGSLLRDAHATPVTCHSCRTNSAALVRIEDVDELALDSIESVHGTRCDACGDVRLYQVLKDGTTDPDIRTYLDDLALLLTAACYQEASRERH